MSRVASAGGGSSGTAAPPGPARHCCRHRAEGRADPPAGASSGWSGGAWSAARPRARGVHSISASGLRVGANKHCLAGLEAGRWPRDAGARCAQGARGRPWREPLIMVHRSACALIAQTHLRHPLTRTFSEIGCPVARRARPRGTAPSDSPIRPRIQRQGSVGSPVVQRGKQEPLCVGPRHRTPACLKAWRPPSTHLGAAGRSRR